MAETALSVKINLIVQDLKRGLDEVNQSLKNLKNLKNNAKYN